MTKLRGSRSAMTPPYGAPASIPIVSAARTSPTCPLLPPRSRTAKASTLDQLRAALGLTHSGAVRLVDRLEEDGLVRRARAGGRAVAPDLTARGRRALTRLERVRLEASAELLTPFSASKREQLELLLRRMLAAQTANEADLNRICRLCSFEAARAAA